MMNVIMDVDTGVDDAIAIILAVKSKKINILGITTVMGNVTAMQGAINTKKVLKLINAESIPVVSGSEYPMSKDTYVNHTDEKDGFLGALSSVEIDIKDIDSKGIEFLIETISKNKEQDITLILTAPLTNIAMAIKKAPNILNNIKEAIIMGGANECSGNITPYAEFNFYKDPEAAHIVLNSGIPIKLISLDVTNKVLLTREDIEKIEDLNIRNFISKITEPWAKKYEKIYGIKGCPMHDPLTVAYALDNSIVETEKYSLNIVGGEGINKGQIVSEKNILSPIYVSTKANDEDFKKMFLKIINL